VLKEDEVCLLVREHDELGEVFSNSEGPGHVLHLREGRALIRGPHPQVSTQVARASAGFLKHTACSSSGFRLLTLVLCRPFCGNPQVPIVASTGGLVDTVKEGETGFQIGEFNVEVSFGSLLGLGTERTNQGAALLSPNSLAHRGMVLDQKESHLPSRQGEVPEGTPFDPRAGSLMQAAPLLSCVRGVLEGGHCRRARIHSINSLSSVGLLLLAWHVSTVRGGVP